MTNDRTNGMRQPHSSSDSASIHKLRKYASRVPVRNAAPAVTVMREAYSARRLLGALSPRYVAAPDHSPPTMMPCRQRRITMRTGAATPMVS